MHPSVKWIAATAVVSALVSALMIRAWVKAPAGSAVSKALGGA